MIVQRKESSFDIIRLASSNTADFNDLNTGPLGEFPVFVIGQTKSDGAYNSKLEGCRYYGPATTWGEDYILKEGPFGNYKYTPEPMIFSLGSDAKEKQNTLKNYECAREINWELAGRLKGEIYGVPLRTLTDLDRWENNGADSHREWKYVTLDNPQSDTNSLRAYVWLSDWGNYENYFQSNRALISCPFRMEKTTGSHKVIRTYYFQQPETMYEHDGYYGGDY